MTEQGEVVTVLDADEARALTDEVRADVRALWRKILTLYEGRAHLALGYPSWGRYWAGEFGDSKSRGDQLVAGARVVRSLEAANLDVPLPANDSVARQLLPVFRWAPEDLADVWTRAVATAANGAPTTGHVKELVSGYTARRGKGRQDEGGKIKRARDLAGIPIIRAHANAAAAADAIDYALEVREPDEVVGEWLEHAEEAARLMAEVARLIRARLAGTKSRRKG